MIDRTTEYRRLVVARKACRRCTGLTNASVIRDGEFDSEEIGPWTRWLGDLHARLLVVGQDWGALRDFEKAQGRHDGPHSATDKMLTELLASVGIPVPRAGVAPRSSGVFLTNAVLCFKDGGCQGPVRPEWVKTCGTQFLRPQIEIIRPRVVVCLGRLAYEAVASEYGLPPLVGSLATVVGTGFPLLPGSSIAFAVYHCGKRGLTYRDREAQLKDWQRVAAALSDPPSGITTRCT